MREISLDELLPHLLYQFKSEHDLVSAIEEISRAFTLNRSELQNYLSDPRLVSAYTLFYLSTNVPKLQKVMELIPKRDWQKFHLVDVGAGPGTFSIAWAHLFSPQKLTQIEASSFMQEQSQKLMQAFFPDIKVDHTLPKNSSSLLLFGHSMNEMGVTTALDFVDKSHASQILLIEPGTKEVFALALKFREEMKKRGFSILYPCPSHDACPLAGQPLNWCHQVIEVRHHPSIERLTQLARKDRRVLPLLIQYYEKDQYVFEGARLFRVLKETKFSFEWEVCQDNQIERWQIEKKHLSKEEQKRVEKLLAGATVQGEVIKVFPDFKRIKLTL
jgi:ribosomal protein RSM22 (predicted rRNA methylase)